MSGALARRIMVRLERAELLEVNPHVQCDIRIAWLQNPCSAQADGNQAALRTRTQKRKPAPRRKRSAKSSMC